MQEIVMEQYLFNQEAEITVLGIFLSDNSFLKETILTPNNFYLNKHQLIFTVMKELSDENKPVDIVSFVEKMGPAIENVGGVSYLSDLSCATTTTANFKYYEGLIIANWKKRASITLSNHFKAQLLESESETIVSDFIAELTKIDEKGIDDSFDLKELLIDMYNDYNEDRPDINGVETAFHELDALTGGLQKQDLIIIAGRPSMGKTAFALNLARKTCQKGTVVGFFSLEMGRKKIMERIWSALANIPSIKFRNPKKFFTNKEWTTFNQSLGYMSEHMNLEIYDNPGVTVQEIYAKSRSLKNRNSGKDIVIMIDYLQLITGSPKHKGNRVQEVAEISRQLKLLARELDVTVIALSQLSRGVEQRQDKRPMMSDLRESGGIEQDADIIGFLYRDDYYTENSDKPNICEFIVSKHRNGPLGKIDFVFLKEYNKFLSVREVNKHEAI